jgi:hypothetical protein
MLYVPLALARQASTGVWNGFWQWRVVWTLMRQAWAGLAGLALLFALLNAGAMVLKTVPYYLPQAFLPQPSVVASDPDRAAAETLVIPSPEPGQRDWDNLSDTEALSILNQYYFGCGLYLFAALVLLRSAAARIYARAVLRAVHRGALGEDQLGEDEWRVLRMLGLLEARPRPRRAWVVRAATWAASRTGVAICAAASVGFWFAFVAAIYVSEFFQAHLAWGFLNQPLAQLPWFRYVPAHLQSPAREVVISVMILLGIGVVVGIAARLRWRPAVRRTEG